MLVDFGSAGTSIRVAVSGSTVDFGAHGQAAGNWWHLAVTRSSGSVKVFINGVQLGSSSTLSGTIMQESDYSLYLGSNPAGLTTYIIGGKLSNIRAVKGVAVYTANFTPPTTNLAATQSANANGNPSAAVTGTETSLLLDMKTSADLLTDGSTYAFTVTNNNSATWSASTPYPLPACGSLSFNGSAYATSSSTVANFGTSDFTAEFWIYPNTNAWAPTYATVWNTDSAGGLWIGKNQGNFTIRASAVADLVDYATLPTVNVWTHVAFSRQGSTIRMFYNGVQVASATSSNNFVNGLNYLGTDGYGDTLDGYLTNIRYVTGTSLYNANFTPPTGPLTAVSGTTLLLDATNAKNALTDGSTTNATFTNTGVVWTPANPY